MGIGDFGSFYREDGWKETVALLLLMFCMPMGMACGMIFHQEWLILIIPIVCMIISWLLFKSME